MATKITRDVLESYLHCPYKGYLKLAGEQGTPSDYAILQAEARNRVGLAATDRLLGQHQEGAILRGVTLTRPLLQQGASLLLDATVEGRDRSIHFDALQKEAGVSRLGDFHYLPVLFDEAERPQKPQKEVLELLGVVLGDLQGRRPEGGLLLHGLSCITQRIRLNPSRHGTQQTLQEIEKLQATGTPPPQQLNSHCQLCEFRLRCQAEATAQDDLSLLRGLSGKEIKKFHRRGIFTVTQLSFTFRPPKRRKGVQPQQNQPHNPALQALAIRDQKIYVLGTPQLPQAATRIYFDLEGDPDRQFAYLLGMIIECNGTEERYSFWANSPDEEPQLFHQLLAVVALHQDACLYAYGNYETVFLRRMIKASGRDELADTLLSRVINVLSLVYTHIYFPTYSNSLKDIGRALGFSWTDPAASGIQSIVWRKQWEESGAAIYQEMLTTYNLEDCIALRLVTEFLSRLCLDQPALPPTPTGTHADQQVSRVEDMRPLSSRPEWCRAEFAVPDFAFINQRAYFDYQRDRIFIRTNKALKQRRARRRSQQGKRDHLPTNRSVELTSQTCPSCGGTDLTRRQDGRLVRWAFDLRISHGSIRRWVTRFTTTRHQCNTCHRRFLPRDYLRLDVHFHSLKSWAMYEHVAHRASFSNIKQKIRDYFGFPVYQHDVLAFKRLLSQYYAQTYQQLLDKLVRGATIHADETEVHLKRTGKGYVWVFTNQEEVVFLYRPSREGGFLHELLEDFHGVLISDFYAPYDALPCAQQKCLIHLIRDFNADIQGNPWDEDLKALASSFGGVLRPIIATIDQYGLRKRHLGKHRRDVERFFQTMEGRTYRSEVAEGYRQRLLRYQKKLFTFLDHDGVPWNNNNAEHAVKRFAYYREVADGEFSEAGLSEYLVLLSIYMTCRYKEMNFLQFLLSQETDIDAYCARQHRRRALPTVELLPD